MPIVTLPDGTKKAFDAPVTVLEVAASIGTGLAKAALAARVGEKLVDVSHTLDTDTTLAIITDKQEEGLDVIRHSCAHLMAQAVKQLFPEAQVTIGPVIEDGFYYDFSYPKAFTEHDLEKIEQRMMEISKKDFQVSRRVMERPKAIQFFKALKEDYKVKIIEDIPGQEPLSFYTQGDFTDLCRGPHVPSTGKIKAFKLMKVAGAYWRGDAKNEMLQRIYGTAWANKKDLQDYLFRLEEAEKRDHRKLAKKYHWFHIEPHSPGMVFWHPYGWTMYRLVEQYIRDELKQHDYVEVKTPQLVDRSLWEKSGHWEKFGEEMFSLEAHENTFVVKPMNCPCHVQIYNQGIKSYRDLPLRMAEFGSCHRNEPSGALHGLLRVRNFVQDDAHIFCTEDQIQAEVGSFIDLLFKVYKDFGFNEVIIKLSTRPEKRVGSDAIWDKAEKALEVALKNKQLDFEICEGEGAFYGPKIEFSLKDCLGRVWQCGTMQVDFSTAERLGASYVAEDGSKQVPVMLHRAIIGTIERFMGILLEDTAGFLPVWLAPVQAVLLNITSNQSEYVQNMAGELRKKGFRVEEDLRNEKIGFKIREHTLRRVPYLLVVGEKEMASQTVAVRTRGGKDLGTMNLNELVEKLNSDSQHLASLREG